MPIYTQESLERLRQRIDLVEVISPHVELKKAGAAHKGLCPFHDEKSPSFVIQRGDHHYHCFGCGAHGDAVQFLMTYLQMSFQAAIENLAERFHVHLDQIEGEKAYKGPSKSALKEALSQASRFFHFYLLHSPEGHEALHYLYQRGLSLDFIRTFQIGFAPKTPGLLRMCLHEKHISDEIMLSCGLLSAADSGRRREFFSNRITFPVHDQTGAVIGFSARKYKEETFGGKYVNTPETPLFKKSRILFGVHYSRRRIIKERKVIVVEGQLDALSLIYSGFTFTVAGQGTAFGEGHVEELMGMGVSLVYLALDSDGAGLEAAVKIGHLFQREGVEVKVVSLPQGSDPDAFLRERGAEGFAQLLEASRDYLEFLVEHCSKSTSLETPAGKNALVQQLVKQIRTWKHPLMMHESLRKIARLTNTPEEMIGVGQEYLPNIHIRKSASIGFESIDPVQILESDFLRWILLFTGRAEWIALAEKYLKPESLQNSVCRSLYQRFLSLFHKGEGYEILSLVTNQEEQSLISLLSNKKVDHAKANASFVETIQRILDRNWMEKREEIKRKIHSGQCSDEEALALLKEFDALKHEKPTVITDIKK